MVAFELHTPHVTLNLEATNNVNNSTILAHSDSSITRGHFLISTCLLFRSLGQDFVLSSQQWPVCQPSWGEELELWCCQSYRYNLFQPEKVFKCTNLPARSSPRAWGVDYKRHKLFKSRSSPRRWGDYHKRHKLFNVPTSHQGAHPEGGGIYITVKDTAVWKDPGSFCFHCQLNSHHQLSLALKSWLSISLTNILLMSKNTISNKSISSPKNVYTNERDVWFGDLCHESRSGDYLRNKRNQAEGGRRQGKAVTHRYVNAIMRPIICMLMEKSNLKHALIRK